MSHIVRTILGVALIVLGVIGSLLPVVPGFVFFAAAIAVLGSDHVIVRHVQPYVLRVWTVVRAWLERRGILKPQKP